MLCGSNRTSLLLLLLLFRAFGILTASESSSQDEIEIACSLDAPCEDEDLFCTYESDNDAICEDCPEDDAEETCFNGRFPIAGVIDCDSVCNNNNDGTVVPCKQNSPCENEEQFCNYAVECRDYNKDCNYWANNGECDNNPDYMLENCPLACGECFESSGFCMECHSNESFCSDLGLTDDGVRDCESVCFPISSENCSNNSPCGEDNEYLIRSSFCNYGSDNETNGYCQECPLNESFCSDLGLTDAGVNDCKSVCPKTCAPYSPISYPRWYCGFRDGRKFEFCNYSSDNETNGYCQECPSNTSFCSDLGLPDNGVINCEFACATGTCEPDSETCGKYSIARMIENENRAEPGYSTVGGGLDNDIEAVDKEDQRDFWAVIGGGYKNGISQLCEEVSCDDISIKLYSTEKSVISGGEDNYLYAEKYAVVNGGADNGHHGSSINIHGFPPESQGGLVITGGEDNIDMTDNALPAPQRVISGGDSNMVRGPRSVVSGGSENEALGVNTAIMGGRYNVATGSYSFVAGGNENTAAGKHSIAMGQYARVRPSDTSSMVINLQGNKHKTESTASGQFLVQAKSFRFQVTNNPGPDNENVLFLDADNIQNLQNAIDAAQPANAIEDDLRRILHPNKIEQRDKRERDRERRHKKLEVIRDRIAAARGDHNEDDEDVATDK